MLCDYGLQIGFFAFPAQLALIQLCAADIDLLNHCIDTLLLPLDRALMV